MPPDDAPLSPAAKSAMRRYALTLAAIPSSIVAILLFGAGYQLNTVLESRMKVAETTFENGQLKRLNDYLEKVYPQIGATEERANNLKTRLSETQSDIGNARIDLGELLRETQNLAERIRTEQKRLESSLLIEQAGKLVEGVADALAMNHPDFKKTLLADATTSTNRVADDLTKLSQRVDSGIQELTTRITSMPRAPAFTRWSMAIRPNHATAVEPPNAVRFDDVPQGSKFPRRYSITFATPFSETPLVARSLSRVHFVGNAITSADAMVWVEDVTPIGCVIGIDGEPSVIDVFSIECMAIGVR